MTQSNFQLISDKVDEHIARNGEGVEIDLAPTSDGEVLSSHQVVYRKNDKTLTLGAFPSHHFEVLFYHIVVISRPLVWDEPNDAIKITKEEEKQIVEDLTEAFYLINSQTYFTEMKRVSPAENEEDMRAQGARINAMHEERKRKKAAKLRTEKQLKMEKRLEMFYIKEEKRAKKNIAKLVKRLEAGKLSTPTLYERIMGKLVDLLPNQLTKL